MGRGKTLRLHVPGDLKTKKWVSYGSTIGVVKGGYQEFRQTAPS